MTSHLDGPSVLMSALALRADPEVCFLPLFELGWFYGALFIAYVVLCLFGVMNVVTSVFVESAVMSAHHYKHLIIQEKAHEREIATGRVVCPCCRSRLTRDPCDVLRRCFWVSGAPMRYSEFNLRRIGL